MHLRLFCCTRPCCTVFYPSVSYRTFVCRISFTGEWLHSTIFFPSLLLPHAGWPFSLAKVNAAKSRLPSNLCFVWHCWSKWRCGRQYVCYLHIKTHPSGSKLAIRKQRWVRTHKLSQSQMLSKTVSALIRNGGSRHHTQLFILSNIKAQECIVHD